MLSMIIPVHNEADNLARIVAEVEGKLMAMGEAYELIIAEDGSTDGSAGIARRLESR